MEAETAERLIEERFKKAVAADRRIHVAHLLVHSEDSGLHVETAASDEGVYSHPKQPYFTASIGKLFTSVILANLEEQGALSYDDRIAEHLDADIMRGLHVHKGIDHSQEVTVGQLLNHSSGLHDYFEEGRSIRRMELDVVLADPDRFWTPREIVEYSKANKETQFPPGEGFYYSSTGFHLLGLLIEELTSMPYHRALSSFIFRPLGMASSYLIQYSEPMEESEHPVAGVYLGGTDAIGFRSLSEEYAAGGVVSTSEDLLRFTRSFADREIVSGRALRKMQEWRKFSVGLDYGYGLMRFRSIPLIMPFELWGHAGSTGAFMFHNPSEDIHVIGSVHQLGHVNKAMRIAFGALATASKVG